MRKGKGLEVPCKYSCYCGPTKNLVLMAFIFVIVLFLLATRHLYAIGHNSRQYDGMFKSYCCNVTGGGKEYHELRM